MSVKFEKETIRTSGVQPEDLAHKLGERLTGGNTQTGYLAVCLKKQDEKRMRMMNGIVSGSLMSQFIIAGLP
jgi:hypothetical protein